METVRSNIVLLFLLFIVLLLAPALKALTQLLIENMTLTKFFGLAEVDSLLSEFILDDLNDQNSAPGVIQDTLATNLNFVTSSAINSSSAPTSVLNPGSNLNPLLAATANGTIPLLHFPQSVGSSQDVHVNVDGAEPVMTIL